MRANPLSKVPTLIRDDGVPMFGGPVIYEYLDSLHDGAEAVSTNDPAAARWDALRLFGLVRRACSTPPTCGSSNCGEPEGEKSPFWIDRYQAAVDPLPRSPRARGRRIPRRFPHRPRLDRRRAALVRLATQAPWATRSIGAPAVRRWPRGLKRFASDRHTAPG